MKPGTQKASGVNLAFYILYTLGLPHFGRAQFRVCPVVYAGSPVKRERSQGEGRDREKVRVEMPSVRRLMLMLLGLGSFLAGPGQGVLGDRAVHFGPHGGRTGQCLGRASLTVYWA